MRRLLICAFAAAALAAAVSSSAALAATAPEQMQWSVIDRFGGDADGDGLLDDPGPRQPARLDVFPVLVRPSPGLCREAKRATWSVDGVESEVDLSGGRRCKALLTVRGESAPHTIEARAPRRSEVATVEVDDRLVVALGDSVASGEGNPEGPELWLDRPCHRSAAAGFEQSARVLASGPTHRSITFVSLACSGATIDEGLLGAYDGVSPDPKGVLYEPQVTRLAKLARARGAKAGEPAVDAVLVSIGANDVRFSRVVEECGGLNDCRENSQPQVFANLAKLRGGYNRLGDGLERAAPGAPVLISEYFDPTRDENGRFCDVSVAFTSHGEARWAYESLLRPLNTEIEIAAVRNGWQPVGGITAAFEQHGYCASDEERWVGRLLRSARVQGDLKGTLHPNGRGHREIAWLVAVPLAEELGLKVPRRPPEEEAGDETVQTIAIAIGATIGLLALGLLGWLLLSAPLVSWPWLVLAWLLALIALPVGLLIALAMRLGRLLRPTGRDDPCSNEPARPELKPVPRPETWWHGAMLVAAIVVLGVIGALLASQVGASILWLRFWSSHLPADQAVDVVSRDELLTTGAQGLALFLMLGLVAMGLAWVLDGKGRWVRATRRGLVAIGLAEVLAAILIGEFRSEQAIELFVGIAVAALLLDFLVDLSLAPGSVFRAGEPLSRAIQGRLKRLRERRRGNFWRRLPLRIWRALPFVALALATYWALTADGPDRALIGFAFAAAAILFILPGGHASKGVEGATASDEQLASLDLPRVALAVAGVVAIMTLIVRDEAWLAVTAWIATLLGLFCLTISAASAARFAPYGLAVLISVPLFGAGAAMVRGLDSPQLQPVAVLLDGGRPVCGAYVGESDGKLWMARLSLSEPGAARRPESGFIFPIDSERIATRLLGPLEPVARVDAEAVELRDRLLDGRGERNLEHRGASCGRARFEPKPEPSWQRRLAERYQPELVLDREDGFWPVPVKTLFSMVDRRAAICRQVAPGEDNCVRLTTQGAFPWNGGEEEGLEYPAADSEIGDQHDLMVDALGSADPDTTATEYFLVSGGGGPKRPITIQYWFFYPFNYQPVRDGILEGGFHEGDFESVGVLLSGKTGPEEERQPRYFWMARHNEEGRILPWRDDAVEMVNGHPRAFIARGSHASYESCAPQIRYVAKFNLVDDHPTCKAGRQLSLTPEMTPLVDLSRVAWACWHGRFGHRPGGKAFEQIPNLLSDGPRSPLWQQKFDGVVAEPCRGIADPGGREGPGEEVVEEDERVPGLLRERAGQLQPLVDECSDWQLPPPTGTYMVACDPRSLKEYVEDGLVAEEAEIRIDVAGSEEPERGTATLPAVRRDRGAVYLDDWRLVATSASTVSVYATCPRDGGIVGARFGRVPVEPGQPLRIVDQTPGSKWHLIEENGEVVARALPFSLEAKGEKLVEKPSRRAKIACSDS